MAFGRLDGGSVGVLGPVQMARVGSMLYLAWTHYENRAGSKPPRTWNGRLLVAGFDLSTGVLHPGILADRPPAPCLNAFSEQLQSISAGKSP